MVKRILYGGAIFLLLVGITIALALVFFIRSAGQVGSGTIEQWVGSQLQLIANMYLNPTLSFEELDYEYPGTIRLKHLKLTAGQVGETVDILGSDEAVITLAEIPSIGQPVVIERITLTRPLFQAIAVEPGSSDFVGFSKLIRQAKSPADQATSLPADSMKLSDTFRMRRVELIDGRIVYDPRLPDTPPMELDRINTQLDIEPSGGDGWYMLNTALARQPVFDLVMTGRLNLDDFSADQIDVKLAAQLGREHDRYLPPQLQQVLRQYEVEGKLALHLTGSAPIREIAAGALETSVDLTHANLSAGEYRIPVRELTVRANLAGRIVHVPTFRLNALDGQANLIAFVALNDTLDTDLKLFINKMKLEDTLHKKSTQAQATYSGLLSADVQASAPMAHVIAAASDVAPKSSNSGAPALPEKWGHGTIRITEGRIVNLPLFDDLVNATTGVSGQSAAKKSSPNDRAEILLTMSSGNIELNTIDFRSDLIAGRGRGTIGLDQRLDLTLNGGPLERVQAMMGQEVGGAFATITDAVGAYRVTGTLSQPRVTYDIGDGMIGETATLAKDTADAVTETSKKEAPGIAKGVGDAAKQGANAVGEGAKEIGKGIKDLFKF